VLCENNVAILRLLSEEVFEFSKYSLTTARADALKASLKDQLQQIFELLMFILDASTRKSLIVATLECLQRYVTWIPEEYIFETPMLEVLCMKFLPVPEFRVPTLQVLTEVCGLERPEYARVFELLYVGVMSQIVRVIPPDTSIKAAYAAAEESGDEDSMLFVRHLALFLTAFLSAHGGVLETEAYREALLSGLNYLVQISDVEDTEVFKICVEYWLRLASSLYETEAVYNPMLPALAAAAGAGATGVAGGSGGYQAAAAASSGAAASAAVRKPLYAEVLSRVREIMIRHMAKPEEVLIERDESGEFVREQQKDTDAIALYKVMRDTMVFLTHLDPRNTEELMLEKLSKQVNGSEWGYDPLNTLCWAIGSISGTMTEQEEKSFLVVVIKDLLLLCETKRGKNNKAVIASNIMYVVGQYPRFLRAHWKFLRTVVMKLFEFMHERHPGVQDMAVDTFLKIAQKCKRRFAQVQYGETHPFIDELAVMLPSVISDLQPHQVHTFYEAAGHMVNAFPDEGDREARVERLMDLPNAMWRRLMGLAGESLEHLKAPETLRELQRVLRTNVFACRSVGTSFAKQAGALFLDMMNVYRTLSSFMAAALAVHGPGVMATHAVKCMTNVKKEVLSLVATYVSVADSPAFVAEHFIPPLLEPVLGDYAAAHPVAREPEVLVLMTEIVNKLRGDILADAPKILVGVFEPTLTMITAASAEEFPEHRLAFFKLVEAINSYCFTALFAIPPDQLKIVVDSVVWALKHTSRETGETGLSILLSLLENVATAGPDLSQPFYAAYLLPLITELLLVLTDRLHKAHFRQHCDVLRHVFYLIESGAVQTPLWESPMAVSSGAAAAYQASLARSAAANGGVVPPTAMSNQQFVREFVRSWVTATFKNLDA
jgi:exportin-1